MIGLEVVQRLFITVKEHNADEVYNKMSRTYHKNKARAGNDVARELSIVKSILEHYVEVEPKEKTDLARKLKRISEFPIEGLRTF